MDVSLTSLLRPAFLISILRFSGTSSYLSRPSKHNAAKLGVATDDLNERIAEKPDEFETEDVDVEQRLERELKRDYHIITAPNRLDAVARDFVAHYTTAWDSGMAMFIAIDKITAVKMHGLIEKHWSDHVSRLEGELSSAANGEARLALEDRVAWVKKTKIAVVVSEEQGEVAKFRNWSLDIQPHRRLIKEGFETADGERIDVESAFKKDGHPFRVAIVCAMWLTGFDVKSLATLYLDKPLKAHTLMQAIARANRVHEGKNNGLIVDYCGILKNLRPPISPRPSKRSRSIGPHDRRSRCGIESLIGRLRAPARTCHLARQRCPSRRAGMRRNPSLRFSTMILSRVSIRRACQSRATVSPVRADCRMAWDTCSAFWPSATEASGLHPVGIDSMKSSVWRR